MKAIYCQRGGSIIGPSSQFCQHCGHQLAINHTADSAIPPSYRGTQTDPRMQENLHLQKNLSVPPPGMGQSPQSPIAASFTPPQPLGYDTSFQSQYSQYGSASPMASNRVPYSSSAQRDSFSGAPMPGSDIGTVKPSNKSALGRLLIVILIFVLAIGAAGYWLYDALAEKNQIPVEAMTGMWSGYLLAEEVEGEDAEFINDVFGDIKSILDSENNKGTALLYGMTSEIPLNAEYDRNILKLTYFDGSEQLSL